MEFASKNLTMGQMNAIVKMLGGEEGALRFLSGKVELAVKLVLDFIGFEPIVSTQPATTTSEEYFKTVGIVWTDSGGFIHADSLCPSVFLDLDVPSTRKIELAISMVNKEMREDGSILTELGDKAEILICEFRAFLALHRESRSDFIFYLRGKDGELRQVKAHWSFTNHDWKVCLTDGRTIHDCGDNVISRGK